ALRSRDLDRASQIQEGRCPGHHGPVALDAEHDLVALLDPKRVPNGLWYGDLPLRRDLRGSIHARSPYLWTVVRISENGAPGVLAVGFVVWLFGSRDCN